MAATRSGIRLAGGVLVLLVLLTGCPSDIDKHAPRATPQKPAPSLTPQSVIPEDVLPFPAPSSKSFSAAVQVRFAQALTEALKRPQRGPLPFTTGVTAAVVSADGTWSGAAGVGGDGAEALRPDSMLAIGSVTKTFTAAEVVTLARRGQLKLDAAASSYLTHPLLGRHPTVRQLLCMTSGIPEHTNSERFERDVAADPDRHWDPPSALSYADQATVREPGTAQYSNSNYLLLDMIIEMIARLPYRDALRSDLLQRWEPPRLAIQDAEPSESPLGAPGPEANPRSDRRFLPTRARASAAGAAGGIAADAPTLASWGYELYGGRILPPDDVRQMATACDGGYYGMGTHIGTQGIPAAVGHGGGIPGYSSHLLVIPGRRLSIAVLAPWSNFDAVTTAEELARAVLAVR